MIGLFAFASVTGAAAAQEFPLVKGDNLNGVDATFPADLPGDPTLVLVAFTQEQQLDVDRWVAQLDLKTNPPVAWIEMPTLGRRYRPMKPMLDGWMRDGIPATEDRERVFTVFTNDSRFRRTLGVSSKDDILAVLARPSGEVKLVLEGPPDADKIAVLTEALGE